MKCLKYKAIFQIGSNTLYEYQNAPTTIPTTVVSMDTHNRLNLHRCPP